MRGTPALTAPSRVKGAPALLRRTRALYLAACRFSLYRARTRDDRVFSAVLLDGLRSTLAAVDPGAPKHEGPTGAALLTTTGAGMDRVAPGTLGRVPPAGARLRQISLPRNAT